MSSKVYKSTEELFRDEHLPEVNSRKVSDIIELPLKWDEGNSRSEAPLVIALPNSTNVVFDSSVLGFDPSATYLVVSDVPVHIAIGDAVVATEDDFYVAADQKWIYKIMDKSGRMSIYHNSGGAGRIWFTRL